MSIPVGDTDTSASSTTDAAKKQASGLASKVQKQGSVAADSLQHGGQQIAGEAKVQGGKLNDEVHKQIHSVLEQAQSELGGRATEQTDKAATNLRGLGDALHALAEGRTEEASQLLPYVRQVGDRASEYADRLETGGFAGVTQDLSTFARRRPGLFLLGALAAGFASARLVRGAQKAGDVAGQPQGALTPSPLAETRPPLSSNDLADGYGAVAGAGAVIS